MNNLQESINNLIQQVRTEKIKTIDLVEELNALYNKVESLTNTKEYQEKEISSLRHELNGIKGILSEYKKEYVIPAQELKEQQIKLEYDNRDWQLEKKYIIRENDIFREVLAAITTTKNVSMGGNGTYYNEVLNKPYLPKVENK